MTLNWILLLCIILLILVSTFFSAAETSMMAINRYRLRHLAKYHQLKSAQRAQQLLLRPDWLLGTIVIGNTVANIVASALMTILAQRLWGDWGVAVAAVVLTAAVLLFGETLPKTFAALRSQATALHLALPLLALRTLFYPLVFVLSSISNGLLRLIGVNISHPLQDPLSKDELYSMVRDSEQPSAHYRQMLLGVMDLEKVTVEHVMIPRTKMVAIDINRPWPDIIKQLQKSPYSKVPVYREDLNNLLGILHLRRLSLLLNRNDLNKKSLLDLLSEPHFAPLTAPLQAQLAQFQHQAHDVAMVVDEYGDIQGLITLEDILEEIAGEFTQTNQPSATAAIHKSQNGSFVVNADLSLRDINRELQFDLPTTGPKTLNGLITEHLQAIPTAQQQLTIEGYRIEVLQVRDNTVIKARITPIEGDRT